jgi:hypothetical protein
MSLMEINETDGLFSLIASLFWPIFMAIMFSVNMLIREGYFGFLRSFAYHSRFARKTAVWMSNKEKETGMFTYEIQKLNMSFFPVDIFLSLYYGLRVRGLLKNWDIAIEERKNIDFIHGLIKDLSAKFISLGNSETTQIIQALKDKAQDCKLRFLKNEISFSTTRGELIEIVKDLDTVGDILEAKNTDSIDYYDILGVKEGAEVKEIRKAFYELIKILHPDKSQGNGYTANLAVLVNKAYTVLKNPDKRTAYNEAKKYF